MRLVLAFFVGFTTLIRASYRVGAQAIAAARIKAESPAGTPTK
jgi:hypothetical protein